MSKILSTLALISTLFAFDAKAEATNQLTLGTVVDSDNGSGSEDLYVSFVACHPGTALTQDSITLVHYFVLGLPGGTTSIRLNIGDMTFMCLGEKGCRAVTFTKLEKCVATFE